VTGVGDGEGDGDGEGEGEGLGVGSATCEEAGAGGRSRTEKAESSMQNAENKTRKPKPAEPQLHAGVNSSCGALSFTATPNQTQANDPLAPRRSCSAGDPALNRTKQH
jgi:hypothetical protein